LAASFFAKKRFGDMKILNGICFFLLFVAIGCEENPKASQQFERIERFENGAISRRAQIVDGEKQGLMTDYYPDGKVLAERWFKDDRQHGRTAIYYPSGKIKEAQYYQLGEQRGGDTIWYESGQPQFTTFFQNGKKNGHLRKWAETGDVIFEALYSNDTVVEIQGQPVRRDSTAGGR
jgi:antitoxin component YwqK of YwqJK toxin-antitoxin module